MLQLIAAPILAIIAIGCFISAVVVQTKRHKALREQRQAEGASE